MAKPKAAVAIPNKSEKLSKVSLPKNDKPARFDTPNTPNSPPEVTHAFRLSAGSKRQKSEENGLRGV